MKKRWDCEICEIERKGERAEVAGKETRNVFVKNWAKPPLKN
jgi:hypothetical protein